MKIRPRILRRITPAEWRGNMANVISDETIEYVGILAKLELSDEEKEAAKKDMASMLDHIDKLNELDTTGVEPMSHVFPVENVMREDVVTNGDGSEATLANAPEVKENAFTVKLSDGTIQDLEFDYGFNCLGMRSNNPILPELQEAFADTHTHIYTIGDSVRARRIMEGTMEGRAILNVLESQGYLHLEPLE